MAPFVLWRGDPNSLSCKWSMVAGLGAGASSVLLTFWVALGSMIVASAAQDDEQGKMLHQAAIAGRNIADSDGQTPLDHARKRWFRAIAALIAAGPRK